jgi:hypothetical protein
MQSAFEPIAGTTAVPKPTKAARTSFEHRRSLVERNGVVMPLGIAEAMARAATGPSTYDSEGRREIFADAHLRRQIDRVINFLAVHGLGLHVVCNLPKPDGTMPCGSPMDAIGGGRDAGFACKCQRIYFR